MFNQELHAVVAYCFYLKSKLPQFCILLNLLDVTYCKTNLCKSHHIEVQKFVISLKLKTITRLLFHTRYTKAILV